MRGDHPHTLLLGRDVAGLDRGGAAPRNLWNHHPALNTWYENTKRKHELRWFRTLRDDYADTRFYQDILRECGYFKRFVQTGKLGL